MRRELITTIFTILLSTQYLLAQEDVSDQNDIPTQKSSAQKSSTDKLTTGESSITDGLTTEGLSTDELSTDELSTDEPSTKGALIYCEQITYNFGIVDRRRNESISHTFTIENRGDEPLIIKRVERSCSCMKASLSKRPIAPGESREMRVSYEVRKMPPGLFSKVVQIYSTSRDDTGFTQFTITGRSVNASDYRR